MKKPYQTVCTVKKKKKVLLGTSKQSPNPGKADLK